MRNSEAKHPFYRPLWVRILLVVVIAVWCVLEWINDQAFWGVLTGAALAWAIYSFFITYDPSSPPKDAAAKDGNETGS